MPSKRPVVQILAGLAHGDAPSARAERARAVALRWVSQQTGVVLPPEAHAGLSFSTDIAEGHPVAAEAFGGYWGMQYDKFDSDVPGRTWRTEIAVAHSLDAASCGLRLSVIDQSESPPFYPSVPRLAGEWVGSPGLVDYGIGLSTLPGTVRTQRGVQNLVALLTNPERTRPVLILADGPNCAAIADATSAARVLTCLAHVFVLPEPMQHELTRLVGRDFAVWHGAIRTYHPGFDPSADENFRHPVATRGWIDRRFEGVTGFINVLYRNFLDLTVRGGRLEESLPSLGTIRQHRLAARIAELPSQPNPSNEREDLLEQEVQELRTALAEARDYAAYSEGAVAEADEERERYRWQASALRGRISALEDRIGAREAVAYPESLESLEDWVGEYFSDRLQVLSRGVRAARKSTYEDPRLVYRCLERLALSYVDARRNGKPVEGIFDDLGVHLERTGDPARLAAHDDGYFFSLRGRKRFLDFHLKRGTSHDDRTTLRIYFLWDEEDEVVIVGHLPSHLTNAVT